jgi:hypothetical protein
MCSTKLKWLSSKTTGCIQSKMWRKGMCCLGSHQHDKIPGKHIKQVFTRLIISEDPAHGLLTPSQVKKPEMSLNVTVESV